VKAIIVLLAISVLAGCWKSPEATQDVDGTKVGRLFTVEGCSVYRFWDGAKPIYFTNCKGSTHTSESCGKNCTYDRTISGGAQ
jgi:hypothetical protein